MHQGRERWYLDRGCSRHMTWDINNSVTLSGIMKVAPSPSEMIQRVNDIGNIKIGSSLLIEDVVLVNGLKYNLLSISQLCDKGLRVIFDDSTYDVLDKKINTCVLSDFHENNIYLIDILNLEYNATCLDAFNENSWDIED